MKRFILSGIFSLVFIFSFSQTTFQKIYGGIHDDEGTIVKQTFAGGYMIGGSTNSYGAGGYDYYLIKTNSLGDTTWTKTYGTADDELLCSAQQTADGGYVLGGTAYNYSNYNQFIYVVKTTSTGSLSWSKTYFLMKYTWTTSVQQTQDGGFIVSGYCDSVAGPTPYQYSFLMKLDASGNITWNKIYLINGYCSIQSQVKELSTGGYVMTGGCENANSTNDVMVIRTDAAGNIWWVKAFDTGNYEFGFDIVQASNGDFVLIGETESQTTGVEMYVLRISNLGALVWSKKYNNINYGIYPRSIIADANGNFFIAGFKYSTADGSGFVSKIDQSGQLLSTSIYGLNVFCGFTSSDFTSDGGMVMAGAISYATTPTDSGSLYVVKVDGNGNSGCNQTTFAFATINQVTATTTPTVILSNGIAPQNIATLVGSGCMIMDGCSVGIEERENNSDAKVFPNPFSEKATIEVSGDFTNEKSEFELMDVNGNIVRDFYFTGNTTEIQRENISSGIYFYRITSKDQIISTGKIIVE
jgi:hypothetical protein